MPEKILIYPYTFIPFTESQRDREFDQAAQKALEETAPTSMHEKNAALVKRTQNFVARASSRFAGSKAA